MNTQKLSPKQVLAHSPLFQELGEGELEAIAAQAYFKFLSRGQMLFGQGDLAEALYVVAAGLIKVFQPDARKGRQLVLSLEGQFRLIDPAPALLEPPFHQASAEALEDSVLLVIPRATFLNLLDTQPTLSKALVRFLAKRQRQLEHLLDRLVFYELEARLAEYLLARYQQEGQGFELPTNSELAALLGTVPELVSRRLGQFFRQKLIRLQRRRVWLDDPKSLQDLSGL